MTYSNKMNNNIIDANSILLHHVSCLLITSPDHELCLLQTFEYRHADMSRVLIGPNQHPVSNLTETSWSRLYATETAKIFMLFIVIRKLPLCFTGRNFAMCFCD